MRMRPWESQGARSERAASVRAKRRDFLSAMERFWNFLMRRVISRAGYMHRQFSLTPGSTNNFCGTPTNSRQSEGIVNLFFASSECT